MAQYPRSWYDFIIINLERDMNILFYLMACGGKCPDGFVANDDDQSCECPSGTELSSDQSTCETKEVIDTGADPDTDDTGEDTETGETGEDTPVDPWDELERINGKIIIPTLFEGRVIPRSSFYLEQDGKLLLYMSASNSATCDVVGNHLNINGTRPDPSSIFVQDHCNLRITLQNSTDLNSVAFFAECTFGTGSFSSAGSSWQWSGTDENGVDAEYFEAAALNGIVSAMETEVGRIAMEMEVTEWAGSFPYSDNYTTSEAVGTGAGYIIAEECASLANATFFEEPPE